MTSPQAPNTDIAAMISPTTLELAGTITALNTLLYQERQQSAAQQQQHEAEIEQIRSDHAAEIRTLEARLSVAEALGQVRHDSANTQTIIDRDGLTMNTPAPAPEA